MDGLTWTARQDDTAQAVVLFGTRVAEVDLAVSESPSPLAVGDGLDRVRALLDAADILLAEP